jgi:hypothetical protein
MISLRGNEAGPKGLVGLSILIVLLAIGSVGLFGVIENARVKDAAEGAIAYDVAVAEAGDNLRVAVLDVRHAHRNIAFSGESETTVADFDASYATLLREIDRLSSSSTSSSPPSSGRRRRPTTMPFGRASSSSRATRSPSTRPARSGSTSSTNWRRRRSASTRPARH